jgi:hypothetical protein
MISRKTGLVIVGSALLLAACHKTETNTQVDANIADTSNAAMSEDLGNDSNAANATDELDNGDRTNSDTRGKPAPSAQ